MSEIDGLKKLVRVLTNQRNFAFDRLAEMEAMLLAEREASGDSRDGTEGAGKLE